MICKMEKRGTVRNVRMSDILDCLREMRLNGVEVFDVEILLSPKGKEVLNFVWEGERKACRLKRYSLPYVSLLAHESLMQVVSTKKNEGYGEFEW